MPTLLSQDTIAKLPVHDADFHSLTAEASGDGSVTIRVTIEINPEESMIPFLEMGMENRRMTLRFANCRHTVLNLIGITSDREQVLDWEAFPESDLSAEVPAHLPETTGRFLRHKLQLSAGSHLEIVAERCSIEGQAQ